MSGMLPNGTQVEVVSATAKHVKPGEVFELYQRDPETLRWAEVDSHCVDCVKDVPLSEITEFKVLAVHADALRVILAQEDTVGGGDVAESIRELLERVTL